MVIKLEKVGKQFAYRWLYRDIDLVFNSPVSYAVKGPNGSGKSTLLKLIATYLLPSKGTVKYFKNGAELAPDQVAASLVFTAPYVQLIDEFTLGELYDFHSTYRSVKLSKQAWIDLLDFGHEVRKPIQYFSSGMKQRVNLSLSLCTKAEVFLIDEPTTNLDIQGKAWYRSLIDQFCQNTLLIIASNDAEDHDFCQESISVESL